MWLCVLVRAEPEPSAGHFVVVHEVPEARAFLGCLVDAGGTPQGWLELWVQDFQNNSVTFPSVAELLNNSVLDEHWKSHFHAVEANEPNHLIRTGWETEHPVPTWVDLAAMSTVPLNESVSGGTWNLCRDDALLRSQGLPAYSSTFHRYLYVAELGAASPFVPLTDGAPDAASVKPMGAVTGGRKDLIPFNPGGGLMLVRRFTPTTLAQFSDILAGMARRPLLHGKTVLNLPGIASAADDAEDTGSNDGAGWLFMGRHGQFGRLIEAYHLKLRGFADAIASVRALVNATQRPLLNLSADSFRTYFAEDGAALPSLWTAHTELHCPGEAVEQVVPSTDDHYFLPARPPVTQVYHPEALGRHVSGRGVVRIRRVAETNGMVVVEGTFTTQDGLRAAKSDLVRMFLNVGSGRVDLHARLETETAMAAGEWRFKTLPQSFTPEAARQLYATEGSTQPETRFTLLPLLSTPCDLYALGVIGVRLFLVNPQTTLAVAKDELLSLATQVAQEYDSAIPLPRRIASIFAKDSRWMKSLGPHRLTVEIMKPETVLDIIPPELWWETLAMLVRMFAGVGLDSICMDYGQAPAKVLQRVFDSTRAAADRLLTRTRSLLFIDWRFNREIHAVIQSRLTGLSAPPPPAPAKPAAPPLKPAPKSSTNVTGRFSL